MDQSKITFIALDLAVISVLSLLFANLVTIQLISPSQSIKTTERRPLFAWGGMQGEYVIFVDDNSKFTSPLAARVTGNSYRFDSDIDFGAYYWKVMSGPLSSGAGRFTVVSSVVLAREKSGVKNEGNTPVLLSAPSITGAFVLAVNESAGIGAEENVRAEQA